MKFVSLADVTLKQATEAKAFSLSFKEKIDVVRILDRLNISVIEIGAIEHAQRDALLLKSLAATVKNSILAVPVGMTVDSVAQTAAALAEAPAFRLQVVLPVSAVQMEYLCHKKAAAMLELIQALVAEAKKYTADVEFAATDATRAEADFLQTAIDAAVKAGATTVTLCDNAGTFLPAEFVAFVESVKSALSENAGVKLGVYCDNALALADASVIGACNAGIDEIKVAVCGEHTASLPKIAHVLEAKGDVMGIETAVRYTELFHGAEQISRICLTNRSKNSPFDNGVSTGEAAFGALNSHDELPAVIGAVQKLGYDLSEEDYATVYEAFQRIAVKKETVGSKELESIVASAALQVPPTYLLESYIINNGNTITATAHIKLRKGDKLLEAVSLGDGPIDAAFLAIEQIIGHHYELDDFQIQSVTEGREAMGETIVKLRSEGKLFSGRGISTDIVGSGIRAYINALNKIVYEEA